MRSLRSTVLLLTLGAAIGCASTQFSGATLIEAEGPTTARTASAQAPAASVAAAAVVSAAPLPPPVASAQPPAPPPVAIASAKPPSPRVIVLVDRLLIAERVQFAAASADILPESQMLLVDIATTLNDHMDIQKVRVEGHASSEGDEATNLKLSGERAKAIVTTLIQLGVAEDRLTARGFGSSEPIASNDTEEGREKNRRVAFVILQRASLGKGGTR